MTIALALVLALCSFNFKFWCRSEAFLVLGNPLRLHMDILSTFFRFRAIAIKSLTNSDRVLGRSLSRYDMDAIFVRSFVR